MSYFSQFEDFPEVITSISLDEIENGSKKLKDLGEPPDLRMTLLVARTYEFLGNLTKSKEFATWGLHNIGDTSGLTKGFLRIMSLSECE